MEFVKTHWSRLSIALLFLIGGALAIVFYVVSGAFDFAAGTTVSVILGTILPFISALLYFFGMFAIMLIKTTNKKCVGILYAIIGGLVTILNIIAICVYTVIMGQWGFWSIIVPLLVFGLYPLIKGVTRFVEADVAPLPASASAAPAAKKAK